MTFMGYKRPDGLVGIRNHVLILPTCACASETCRVVSQQVAGSIHIINNSGCAEVKANEDMTQTILRGFAANPNIFGTVVIGLGCENVGHRELREAIEKITNKPIVSFGIQEEGGTLPAIGSGYRVGKGETIILESCEYCNSFLSFFPTVAVILNVDADHLDFFKDLTDIQRSFRKFAELVPADTGWTVANYDNESTHTALSGYDKRLFWFSLHASDADCHAENISWKDGLPSFDILIHGEKYAHVSLKVGGEHNICNALAAASAAYVLGLPGSAVEEGLRDFHGAGRRFEYKGEYHGAKVYDDYAHHPDELHALLTMARSLGCKRLVVAFQPHTYSRTQSLFEEFAKALSYADIAVLTEIYAARETNVNHISSKSLADRIPGAVFTPTLPEAAEFIRRQARPGDLIFTMGAGDIYKLFDMLPHEEV